MDEAPRIPEPSGDESTTNHPQSDGEWSRRRVLTTGLLLLWSAPLITTFALADGTTTKRISCPPGKKFNPETKKCEQISS